MPLKVEMRMRDRRGRQQAVSNIQRRGIKPMNKWWPITKSYLVWERADSSPAGSAQMEEGCALAVDTGALCHVVRETRWLWSEHRTVVFVVFYKEGPDFASLNPDCGSDLEAFAGFLVSLSQDDESKELVSSSWSARHSLEHLFSWLLGISGITVWLEWVLI